MRFESKKGPKRRKKKPCFISWKAFLKKFITPSALHFKDDF